MSEFVRKPKPRTISVWFICGQDAAGNHKVYKGLVEKKKMVYNNLGKLVITAHHDIDKMRAGMPSTITKLAGVFPQLKHAVEYCRLKNGRHGYYAFLYKKYQPKPESKPQATEGYGDEIPF